MNDSEVEAVVKEALTRHQSDAPGGDGLVARAVESGTRRRRWRRRRRAAGLLAVAAVAAAMTAVAIPNALHALRHHHHPPAKRPVTELATTVRLSPPPPGLTVLARSVDETREEINYKVGGLIWTVTVASDRSPIDATYLTTLPSGRRVYVDRPLPAGVGVAEGFHDPVRPPFTFGHLPAGYQVVKASVNDSSPVAPATLLLSGPGGGFVSVQWGWSARTQCAGRPVRIGELSGLDCADGAYLADYHGSPLLISGTRVPDRAAFLASLRWTG